MFKGLKFWKPNQGNDIIGGAPDTFISENIGLDIHSLDGNESVRVDGSIRGNINISNSFIVGETGKINGNIKATDVIIAGEVNGDISCENSIHVTSTGVVKGNIFATSGTVDEGAAIHGMCAIGNGNKDFSFTPVVRTNGVHILE